MTGNLDDNQPMKKICFLIDSIFSYGGVQRVTAVIAKELSQEYDVTIVTFDNSETKDTSLYGLREAPITYRFVSYPPVGWLHKKLCRAFSGFYKKVQPQSEWMSNLYARSSFSAPRRKMLVSVLSKGQYDTIVGVHAPLAARLATMRPWLKGVRCVGWIHNSFGALFSSSSRYIGPELKRHYVYQLRKLDETVVLCQYDAKKYKEYDVRFEPTVIYNPLTLVPGKPSDGTSKRFLAVGRFSRLHKGFDLLIDAFHIFAETNKDWVLDIVGEGTEEQLYREKIASYRLDRRIFLHPFTNCIQEYYSNAQVYVLSSRWEGFGLVLVEAMAHGLPVVSSDLPTSLEIMGTFGLYFQNGNIEDLAEKLHDATMIDWKMKSEEALIIAHRFDVKEIMNQWREII